MATSATAIYSAAQVDGVIGDEIFARLNLPRPARVETDLGRGWPSTSRRWQWDNGRPLPRP